MCGSNYHYTEIKILSSKFLTSDRLKEAGARCGGLKWFEDMFPDGTNIAIAIAACNNPNWIKWTLDAFGEAK